VPDKQAQARLKKDLVIWLVTCGRDGHPHAVPVWFLWAGNSFLIYSVPGQKVLDIEANANVALHLNTDPEGEHVVRVDGLAKIDPKQSPAHRVPSYIRKYGELIKRYDWTPQVFSEQYHVAIRVQPTRYH
jgi:PPOX class probable F420-dependent enzyme